MLALASTGLGSWWAEVMCEGKPSFLWSVALCSRRSLAKGVAMRRVYVGGVFVDVLPASGQATLHAAAGEVGNRQEAALATGRQVPMETSWPFSRPGRHQRHRIRTGVKTECPRR